MSRLTAPWTKERVTPWSLNWSVVTLVAAKCSTAALCTTSATLTLLAAVSWRSSHPFQKIALLLGLHSSLNNFLAETGHHRSLHGLLVIQTLVLRIERHAMFGRLVRCILLLLSNMFRLGRPSAVSAFLSRHSLRSGPSPRLQSDWQEMQRLRWCSQP